MNATPDEDLPEPFFITEEIAEQMKAAGHVFEPPSHVSTTNARELFGLRKGETVAEAIARTHTHNPTQYDYFLSAD